MSALSQFRTFTGSLPLLENIMPVLFIGHGSPMNGIEDNEFSLKWAELARDIPSPTAVLVVSAHWFTRGHTLPPWIFRRPFMILEDFPRHSFDVILSRRRGCPPLAIETAGLIRIHKCWPGSRLGSGPWCMDSGQKNVS